MLHFSPRAVPGRLLFRDWTEGRALFTRVVRACPGLLALAVLPDHFHLLHEGDVRLRLAAALASHAQWLNHRRGRTGPLFRPLQAPDRALYAEKRSRSLRYVHLNPCRARLCDDPLGWPLSTHRDAVGLAAFPVIEPHPDPQWFHEYVSSDPTVAVDGTELPSLRVAIPTPAQVLHATSAVCRAPVVGLARRGPGRTLYLRAAKTLCAGPHREIAAAVGVTRWAVLDARAREDARVKSIARVVGDLRFAPLFEGDLRALPGWRRYTGCS
jgi:hypothetical protein